MSCLSSNAYTKKNYKLDLENIVLKEQNKESMDCEYCQYPFKHCGQYYISTGYSNDPYLYTLRKEDSVGGVMIKHCPWCGRVLDPYN